MIQKNEEKIKQKRLEIRKQIEENKSKMNNIVDPYYKL